MVIEFVPSLLTTVQTSLRIHNLYRVTTKRGPIAFLAASKPRNNQSEQ